MLLRWLVLLWHGWNLRSCWCHRGLSCLRCTRNKQSAIRIVTGRRLLLLLITWRQSCLSIGCHLLLMLLILLLWLLYRGCSRLLWINTTTRGRWQLPTSRNRRRRPCITCHGRSLLTIAMSWWLWHRRLHWLILLLIRALLLWCRWHGSLQITLEPTSRRGGKCIVNRLLSQRRCHPSWSGRHRSRCVRMVWRNRGTNRSG